MISFAAIVLYCKQLCGRRLTNAALLCTVKPGFRVRVHPIRRSVWSCVAHTVPVDSILIRSEPASASCYYAARKAFMLSRSQAIREENCHRDTGVRIAQIVPGVPETNLNGKGHGERRGPIEWVGVDQPVDVANAAVLCSGPTGKEALMPLVRIKQ